MARKNVESRGGNIHAANNTTSTVSQKTSGKIKKKYFSGATRFVFYVNKKPQYVYADYDITQRKGPMRYLVLCVYIVILLIGLKLTSGGLVTPKAIASSAEYTPSVTIYDDLDVLGNTTSLEKAMTKFMVTTGVAPCVVVVESNDRTLTSYRSDLGKYAKKTYTDKFVDQKHWIIIYKYDPDNPTAVDAAEYHGTETKNVITTKSAANFMEILNRALGNRPQYTICQAFEKAFNDTEPVIMSFQTNPILLGIGIAICLYAVVFGWIKFGYNKNERYFGKAVICPSSVTEEKCVHCGGYYVVGTGIACPHCDALFEYNETDDDN